jgi:uncharacterized protein YcfJ
MKTILAAIAGIACTLMGTLAVAQVTLYQQQNFHGRAFNTNGPVSDLGRLGFNDRASSVIVERGQWQVCEDIGFRGYCIVLRPGQYSSLAAMGLNNRVSSLRRVGGGQKYSYAPVPPPAPYPYYPHHGERLYPADVVATRAVVGPPEQRCWVEQQQVAAPSQPNIPGAILGGVLGGVLGHQIGSGTGRDVATAVGAVGGAAVGANVNRGSGQTYTQNVQRCAAVPGSGQVAYWDVTYVFRGVTHRAQLASAPGATINVNSRGEPRM